MAHKKGGGSSRNGRDSNAKRLGVKAFGGETVPPAPSSCASAAPGSTPATASARAATTRCSPSVRASWSSTIPADGSSRPSSRSSDALDRARIRSPISSTHAWITCLVTGVRGGEVPQVRPHVAPLARSAEGAERARRPPSQSGLGQRRGARLRGPQRRGLREVERDPPRVSRGGVRRPSGSGSLSRAVAAASRSSGIRCSSPVCASVKTTASGSSASVPRTSSSTCPRSRRTIQTVAASGIRTSCPAGPRATT